jgi:hypothetical protein
LSRQILTENNHPLDEIFNNPGIWRWIFLKESFHDIRFQEFQMGEDQDFIADLNPTLDEIVFSDSITYRYVRGWGNQLTNRKSAINEISRSIRYLAEKVFNSKANVWHKKFLVRQIFTAIKRGSIKTKIQALMFAIRIAWNYAK